MNFSISSMGSISAVLVSGFILTSCGVDIPAEAPNFSNSSKTAEALPKEVDGGTDGSADGGEDIVAGEGAGGSLEEILKTCGPIDFENPNAEVINQPLAGLPLVTRGTKSILGVLNVDYVITVLGQVSLQSTMSQSVSALSFSVAAEPALAKKKATETVNLRAGTTTTDFVPKDDRGQLADKDKGWEGIVCTVQPGRQIKTVLGSGSVLTAFDPPLPVSVSPKADASRYLAELKGPRSWSGIKATVLESTDAAIKVGTTATGQVTITPISPRATVSMDDGSTVTIQADAAFEVRASFGSPALTNAFGVKPITRFYIDQTRRLYKAIVVDTQDGVAPAATFVADH